MKLILFLSKLFLDFLKNMWGSIQRPYETYRSLGKQDPYQLLIHVSLVAAYFFFISPIKLRTLHPLILTLNASRLFTTALATYLLVCFLFLILAKLLKSEANLRAVLLCWGYSLVPTLLWFFTTSIFYILLPPPRHETVPGRIFSIVFITFSLSLFFWKGILYYLTLRHALKLDLVKIIIVSAIFLPLLGVYSLWMYSLGIFRVPFV